MKDLIIWSALELVKKVACAIWAHFSRVQAIIGCLEIGIQKPSHVVKEELTWSEYKKANGLKYLYSSTPDRLVSFICTEYGGRTSDALIVEKCDFLNKLQPAHIIMADHGLKHIDHLLLEE